VIEYEEMIKNKYYDIKSVYMSRTY